MEKVAFINGGTFIYWSSIILTLAAVSAIMLFAALYLRKSRNGAALCVAIPMSVFTSIILGRLIHWYGFTDSYASFQAAMTNYSWGGYALLGVFAGCLLTALVLRILRICKNLPEMLDCMTLAGGVGIAVGRLACLFNSADRGSLVGENWGLPFAYPVTNVVSGAVENRLATFMIQSMLTGLIVAVLIGYLLWSRAKKSKVRDGDITMLFLSAYGACQIVLDSTRYDSLFMRSNGFISVVQIVGLVAMVLPLVIFSVRMVKANGLKLYHFALWVGFLAMGGVAGYMEYYVQRHGDKAVFAYSLMSVGVAVMVALTVAIRALALHPQKKPVAEFPEEEQTAEEVSEAEEATPVQQEEIV